jgi:hypothetical protein
MSAFATLILFGLMDLTVLGGIVTLSLVSGVSPDAIGFRREKEPLAFWLSLGSVLLLAGAILAGIVYSLA